MEFEKRLKNAMRYRNKTLTELSELSGVNKGTISKYMNGKVQPKIAIVQKIAWALDVAPSYLLGLDNSMTVSVIQPLNHLAPNPEMDMKEELIKEITAMLTWESVENLRTILPVVKALCKGNK